MKLEVKNLTTGYGDTKIIENLNLTIPEGKVTALIGANGCGKSTLLKLFVVLFDQWMAMSY